MSLHRRPAQPVNRKLGIFPPHRGSHPNFTKFASGTNESSSFTNKWELICLFDSVHGVPNTYLRETGVVVAADECMPGRIAEAVLHLCDQPSRVAAMRENARKYAVNRSFDKCFLDFWSTYQ